MRYVGQYDPDSGELIALWRSTAAAAQSIYGNPAAIGSNICRVAKGRGFTAYGYSWKYWKEPLTRNLQAQLRAVGKLEPEQLRLTKHEKRREKGK